MLVSFCSEPGADCLAGKLFVGPEVRESTELAGNRFACIEAHHGDTRISGFLQYILQRIRSCHRDSNAVNLLVDGLLNKLGLAPCFGIAGVQKFYIVLA